MADPWSGFKQVSGPTDKDDDPWSDFKEVSPSKPPVNAPRLPSLGNDSIISTVDGDTLSMSSGRNLRLWGVDAPELKQQGWDRQGQPVPIGRQSRQSLGDILSSVSLIPGRPVSQSYGRPVAPVTFDGNDLGQRLARQGSALAAPDFLGSDPERRAAYMEAERLARLNGLGVHDTMFQPPAEYRQAPMETPTRETVAQFWDSPTPFAGLRPEIEQGYLAISKTGTADDILGYAKANGFTIDPTETKRFVDARNHDATVDWRIGYKDQPKPLTNAGDGTTGAMMRGVGTGALAGGLDEAGALVDSLGLTDGRENVWNSDRRWADIWANNQQQNSSILGYDDMAHPYAALGGELAGGLLVPFGAKARTVPQLFRVGAAYGGAEGFLGTDGDIGQRAIGGAVGVPLGGAIGAAGGKALEGLLRVAPRLAARSGLRMPRRAPASPVGEFGPVGAPRLDDVTDGSIRQRDRIDIGDVPESPAAYAPSHPIRPVAPAAGRDRDVIDVNGGDPWAGFKEVRPAMAMDAEPMPSISSPTRERDYFDMGATRPGRMDDPVTEEQRRAIAEGVDPRDVLPILSNEVGSVEEAALRDAGRYTEARPVNEATALEGRLVRSQNGRELPKRGPLDLVTWLRTRGGVKDQGGNLRAMGIDNAPRDLDFARGEQRFGRLVDDDNGMNLDDAAFSAWEAGYLPGHDRPDINAFLDALDRTHSGSQRYFHPDDFPEVEKFEAMRTDRYALEQQLADGPVHVDRSMPAEESQPFPPPEAYEEWPAGGPDFAGNINLNKLSSPQDIKRALDMTQRRVGFDAATRGRVSNVETERLAGELGMTPEALLSRRKGQALNAEEALAARQILAKSGNELVNAAKAIQRLETPGDDAIADFRQKWVRHVAIQEQVAGMTAEAGRALQQFRMAADSRAVQADVLAAIVRGGGGRERIQDAADLILDAIEKGPGKFNVEVERLAKPQFRDKATELYINSLLTGLQTHTTNIASNTLTALAQPVEHAVAAAIGGARQILPGANVDRVIGSEIGQRAFGLLSGAREGARLFWQALKTGESSDFVSKVEGQDMKAISGLKGEIIRIPTRLLTAEDEFFKGIARRMELNGLAARHAYQEGLRGDAAKSRIAELSANPTDDMLHRSMDYARYVTFQQKLGPAMSKISGFTQDVRPMKLFLPFIRTPTNLLKFAVERSPAAPLLKEWRTDFAAGGARRDLAIAKMMVGSGIGMAIYDAALDGRITGSAPTDPAKAKLLYADGWQPYSIRLGDQWYSYKRMDPFSTTLGIAADMALLPDGMSERQREDKGTLLVASVLGNLASKTWLSGISGLVGALTEPDRKADDLLQRTIGSIAVPTGLSQIARTIDPVQRETDTVGEAIQARIPGLSDNLMPRRDVWGRPVTNEGGIGPDIVSPIYTSTARNDPVNRAMLTLDYAPGAPRREVGGRELTPLEYDRYQAEAGRRAHDGMQELVSSPGWRLLDVDGQQAAAEKVVKQARAEARADLFGGEPADPWADFKQVGGPRSAAPVTNDPWADFKPVEQRDVVGDLQRAIPGVRFTSGFRTPEYQADMRRRGYKPAEDSAHLDGSSLDMLPPPGKSMGWLRDRVGAFDQAARILNEGDHLHVTFPGWYGAPVLGGAKGAGLRNPNAPRRQLR